MCIEKYLSERQMSICPILLKECMYGKKICKLPNVYRNPTS
jgi:hypothetical protein